MVGSHGGQKKTAKFVKRVLSRPVERGGGRGMTHT